MQQWSEQSRAAGHRIALVPTMGALHEGHLRLVEVAHEWADRVVVSIFVNPIQFDRRDDFDAYPQPFAEDLEQCRVAGVHAVYVPAAANMYGRHFQTRVEVGDLAVPMEGAGRPGHFSGVTTVVTKLFHAARPHVAVFGQKDYQQLVIVERMTMDLDFGIEIVRVPTVRDADGVALSSRNRLLDPERRSAARCIPKALAAATEAAEHTSDGATIVAAARAVLEAEPLARVEYLQLADAVTLGPVDTLDRDAVLALAVWFGDVRLIDNVVLTAGPRRR
jgi:pantoate--beta-alanine ligase